MKNNIVSRADLTSFAFAIMQDMSRVMDIIKMLAPVVPTGGTTGNYNVFNNTEAFKVYAKAVARRAIGGHASAITQLSTTATYAAQPYGLRISIDEHEKEQAGSKLSLLEQSRTRTLMINSVISYLNDVITTIKAGVSATAGKGSWSDPNVDPIAEINYLIKTIWQNTGIVPNKVLIDFGAFCTLCDHPKVTARMPGADLAVVSKERLGKLLINPNAKVEVIETSILNVGGLGNESATKKGILGGSVIVCHNSDMATESDPSFFKTFSPTAQLFTEVYSYREEPHLDWLENDWTCQGKLVSALLAGRIDVA